MSVTALTTFAKSNGDIINLVNFRTCASYPAFESFVSTDNEWATAANYFNFRAFCDRGNWALNYTERIDLRGGGYTITAITYNANAGTQSENVQISFNMYDSNDFVVFTWTGISLYRYARNNTSDQTLAFFAIGLNSDTNLYVPIIGTGYCKTSLYVISSGAYGTRGMYPTDANKFDAMIRGATPPEYIWESWPALAGNNGNFAINLSQIESEAIGVGYPEETTSENDIFIFSELSNLRRLSANLQEGVEQTVLYCGNNYATATRRTVEGVGTNIVYVTFKFYYRSGTLAFTSPEIVSHYEGGSVVSPAAYLAIVFDDNVEYAFVNAIQYNPSTGTYKYNLDSLPSTQQMYQLWVWLQDNGQYHEQGTPYDTGSEDNGGDPGTPRPQDPIGDSPLPTISGLNMGIVTLYHPDDTEVAAISQFLWSDNVLDNFKKYFNNFADNILSLYILPYSPASLPTKTFKVGNMTSEITGVEYVTARYYDIDMGSVEVLPRWGSYLDYAPYTKMEIYLPYLGSHSLDVDEIMSPTKQDGTLPTGQGSRIKLKYRLDILTGVIIAKIFINDELRYQFEGKCGASIPLTGQTFASMVQGIVQAGAGLATTIATGGLTAPLSAAAAVAGTVNATKPSIERVGNISGDASMMSSKIPFITISSPSKPYLDNQQKYTGYPSYKAATLGSFSGFTQVVEAHVEGITCTEEERTLILKWLKEGIII